MINHYHHLLKISIFLKDTNSSSDNSDDGDNECDVSDEYLFPLHMAFILWELYVELHKKLNLILIDDKNLRKWVGSHTQQRSAQKEGNAANAKADTLSVYGLSSEQQIQIIYAGKK